MKGAVRTKPHVVGIYLDGEALVFGLVNQNGRRVRIPGEMTIAQLAWLGIVVRLHRLGEAITEETFTAPGRATITPPPRVVIAGGVVQP